MRKIPILAFILILFIVPSVFADGGMMVKPHDIDMWQMFPEEQQYCAINYKNGLQNMILTIDTPELEGKEAVWIFPVPAKPERTVINIIKGFPQLRGYDIEQEAADSINGAFTLIRLSQIYTLPEATIFMFRAVSTFGALEIQEDVAKGIRGVTVHETIEKMGLTTELITAQDGTSFANYINSKDLQIPSEFKIILDDYIGGEFSFVVSWISDIEQFKQEQGIIEREYYEDYQGRRYSEQILPELRKTRGNMIGVSLTFPTDKLYFPLKPTSVYGSERVPAVIYVMDYVTPELYDGIKADSSVEYLFQRGYSPPEDLKDFFFSQDRVYNLKYTKIKINPPSKFLTEDLWIERSAPARVGIMDFVSRHPGWMWFIFLIICSCLASLIAGYVVFAGQNISKGKFALFGLWNFLTLIGFNIAAYMSH